MKNLFAALLVSLLFLSISPNLFAQNVSINADGSPADTSAMLDVSSTTKGFLLPRMTTPQQNSIILPAKGLTIFNTTLNSVMINTGTAISPIWSGLAAGAIDTTNIANFYSKVRSLFGATAPITYSNGLIGITQSGTSTNGYLSSIDWNTFNGKADTANIWSRGGNAVTLAQTIGTITNFDFPFITNNTEKMRLSAGGNLGIGTAVTDGTNAERLLVDAGTNSYNVISGKGNLNNYLQLNIKNTNAGTSASSDIVATNDAGTEANGLNYVDLGVNSSGNTSIGVLGGINKGYLYSTGSDFSIGNATAAKNLVLFTGGVASANERMRIDGTGKVGIGLTAPTAILHLKAGTAAANTAPLKFTSGPLMTTAQAGAIEFLTDKFYATITTGAAREEFTLNDIALTANWVPFATTNGRLTGLGGFTYVSNRLSPTYITLGAGTAAVGGAPLVFTTGINLTTPVTGAVEFDGTHFYGTVGGIRYQLDQQAFDTSAIASFASKVRSLFSSTTPITYSNGLIGITQATTSTDGYLNSTDWNTFNTKGSGSVTNVTATAPLSITGTSSVTPNVVADTSKSAGKLATFSDVALKQNLVTLTTTGSSGAATFNQGTGALNIPAYGAGTGTVTSVAKGYGMVADGTITTTGTVTVDSAALHLKFLGLKDSTIYYPYVSNPKGYLTANQNITVTATGDATGTSTGSPISPALPLTLATVNSNIGSFTNANITVNGKGLITAASNGTAGTVTNIATGYGLSGGPITTAGTIIVDSASLSNYYLRKKDSVNSITGYTTLYQHSLKQNQLSGTGFVKAVGTTISYDNSIYLSANQTISFAPTGDVTGSTTGTTTIAPALVIGTNRVLNTMLAQMPALTIKGNNTGGAANTSDLTVAQVNAILPVFTSTLNGLVPFSGGSAGKVLHGDGIWRDTASAPNSWSVTGNTGTSYLTNFLGTTDNKSLRFRTNNTQQMIIDSVGNVGIGTTTPGTVLNVVKSNSGGGLLTMQNSSASGYSSADFLNSSGALSGTFGYANASTGGIFAGRAYFNSYANDFLWTANSTSAAIFVKGSNSNVGIGTTTPATALHVYGTNPLTLTGVQLGTTTTADSVLTINSGTVQKLPVSTFITAANTWNTTGNTGTSYLTNFLGTFDNKSLRFRTANVQGMILDSIGNVAIGTSPTFAASNPERLLVDAGSGSYNVMSGKGNLNSYLQLNIKNSNAGNAASSDIVATNDAGTEANQLNFIDMGVNSSGYSTANSSILNGVNTAYLYSTGNDLVIGNGTSGKNLLLFTGGTAPANERMRIDGSGNIGIGTTTPAAVLDVSGTTKIGTNGSALNNIFRTTVTIGDATTIATSVTKTYTATVTNATQNATVMINPRSNLPSGIVIAYYRISGAGTLTVGFTNGNTIATAVGSIIYDVTIIQ